MRTMKLKINSAFIPGHKKGQIVDIQVDNNGVPENPFWRRRMKDAALDNCCEFIKEKHKKKEVAKDVR